MAFGGLHSGGRSQDIAEINMIPLIDVMLVLLIIFIITAPLLTHAIKLDLPQAASQPSPQEANTIQLSIQADGTVFWDTEAVDADTWQARMVAAAQQTPQPENHLRADGDLAYRHVARIMADASRAGLVKLGFVTDPRDASAP